MSSKKSSQAQPSQLPARNPEAICPQEVACLEQTPCEPPADLTTGFTCPRWPPQLPAVAAELAAMLSSGAWGQYQAETLERLQQQMASDLGVRHVRLMCSGSAAIELALRACGVGTERAPAGGGAQGRPSAGPQEVICPVLDYPGNVRAVRLLGAIPVLVDSLPGGWTIDPDAVLAAATPRTVAVVVSHLYGEIAKVQTLREICDRQGWALIEDVCQMPGGSLAGQPLGSFGHAAAWSFGGSKPLTAGCGGAITTTDDRIAQRLAAHADRPSDAFPLSPLQAAVLIPQWAALAEFGSRQRTQLKRLVEACHAQTPRWRWPATTQPQQQPVFYKVPVVVEPTSLASPDGALAEAGSPDTSTPGTGSFRPGKCGPDGEPAGFSHEEALARLVQAASACGVPVGQPFRIPERMARARGRIDSSANARMITAKTWLIDHRALAGDAASVDHLGRVLLGLYRRSIGG